jgi:hypothetical protein
LIDKFLLAVISIILVVVVSLAEAVMMRDGVGSDIYFMGGFRNSVLDDETVSSDEEGFVSSALELELLLLFESEAFVFLATAIGYRTMLLFCSIPVIVSWLGLELVEEGTDDDDDIIDDDDDDDDDEISMERLALTVSANTGFAVISDFISVFSSLFNIVDVGNDGFSTV